MRLAEFKQGDLDGLCGLYAFANGVVHHILPVVGEEKFVGNRTFQIALSSLPQRQYPSVIWEGLTVDQLERACRKAAKGIYEDGGPRLNVERPLAGRKAIDFFHYLGFLVDILKEQDGRPGFFIMGLSFYERKERIGGHWLTIRDFKRDGIAVLNHCTKTIVESDVKFGGRKGTVVDVDETLFVSLRD